MPLTPAEQAIVDRFNAATSKIADKIKSLIAGGTDNPDFVTSLTTIADGLDALGAPSQPLPPVPTA